MEPDVADRVALADLLSRHAHAFLSRDFDALDEVFTPDAVLDSTAVGGVRHAWPEAREWLKATFGAVQSFRLHVGDSEINLSDDGSTATLTTTNHVSFVAVEGAPPVVAFGVYEDRAVRTDAGWRLVERVDRPLARMGGAPVGGASS